MNVTSPKPSRDCVTNTFVTSCMQFEGLFTVTDDLYEVRFTFGPVSVQAQAARQSSRGLFKEQGECDNIVESTEDKQAKHKYGVTVLCVC